MDIPESVEAIIRMNAGRSAPRLARERAAYCDIVQGIEAETDPLERALLVEALDGAVRMGSMSFIYVRDEFLADAVRSRKAELKLQRKAKRELVPFALFEDIELVVAQGTRPPGNRNSDQMASGRWPVHVERAYQPVETEGSSTPWQRLTAGSFRGAFHSFGRHTFFVGWVVEEIIRAIEERYDLDFAVLEKARSQRKG